MDIIEIITWPISDIGNAWIGSVLLAFCAVPQAIKSWLEGHSDGISWGMLLMWGVGELMLLKHSALVLSDWALAFNYLANALIIGFILRYKFLPRKYSIGIN